jgi:hypothetical protein
MSLRNVAASSFLTYILVTPKMEHSRVCTLFHRTLKKSLEYQYEESSDDRRSPCLDHAVVILSN